VAVALLNRSVTGSPQCERCERDFSGRERERGRKTKRKREREKSQTKTLGSQSRRENRRALAIRASGNADLPLDDPSFPSRIDGVDPSYLFFVNAIRRRRNAETLRSRLIVKDGEITL